MTVPSVLAIRWMPPRSSTGCCQLPSIVGRLAVMHEHPFPEVNTMIYTMMSRPENAGRNESMAKASRSGPVGGVSRSAGRESSPPKNSSGTVILRGLSRKPFTRSSMWNRILFTTDGNGTLPDCPAKKPASFPPSLLQSAWLTCSRYIGFENTDGGTEFNREWTRINANREFRRIQIRAVPVSPFAFICVHSRFALPLPRPIRVAQNDLIFQGNRCT